MTLTGPPNGYAVRVEAVPGALTDLVQRDRPVLAATLRLSKEQPGAADPLSPLQVAHAEVLARLYIQRHEYAKAAEVSVWGVGPATWGVWV